MKRFIAFLSIAGIACLAPRAFTADHAHPTNETPRTPEQTEFIGEGVDLACYMTSGHNSAKCAANCVEKKGHPAGFKIQNSKEPALYLVISNCDKSEAELFHGMWDKRLKVTGRISSKDGLNTLLVEKVEEAS